MTKPLKYRGSTAGEFKVRNKDVVFVNKLGEEVTVVWMRRDTTAQKLADDLNSRFKNLY